jgi:hypothetical protein
MESALLREFNMLKEEVSFFERYIPFKHLNVKYLLHKIKKKKKQQKKTKQKRKKLSLTNKKKIQTHKINNEIQYIPTINILYIDNQSVPKYSDDEATTISSFPNISMNFSSYIE